MHIIKRIFPFLMTCCFSKFTFGQIEMAQIMQGAPEILSQNFLGNDNPKAKVVSPGLFSHGSPYREIYSENTAQFAGTKDNKLYVRDENSNNIKIIAEPSKDWYWHIDNAMWSPDGNLIAAKQINDTGVPVIKLSLNKPENIKEKTYSRAGNKIPVGQFYIINKSTGKSVAVRQDARFPYIHLVGWSPDNKTLYFIQADRLMKQADLLKTDVSTGETSIILTEKSDTYVIGLNLLQGYSNRLINSGQIEFLEDRDQFIWMSERTGFKQLYLYHTDGRFIRQLTNYDTNGIMENMMGIDEVNNWVYYTGLSNKDKPYEQQVFRTALKQPTIEKVVEDDHIIDIFLSNKKDSLYVLRSGLPDLMQLDLYSASGNFLTTAWKGNTEKLKNGYLNVEYAMVKAADEKTLIPTMLLKPSEFDSTVKYPVVEYIYGGSFDNVVPRDHFGPIWEMRGLAKEGFIVVFIDGRGTPMRGKAFKDFSYGKFGQVEIQDHVAALRQLGQQKPYMDMDKVGIIGHSWGGHFALRALVEAPDVYKAGHLNAAAIDPINFRVPIEIFMGCLPKDCPGKYEKSSVTSRLRNLKAPLMIIHGTADDDVPIDDAYYLIDKLKKIGYKNYEFIPYQGANHIIMMYPKWQSQMIGFFKKTLKE